MKKVISLLVLVSSICSMEAFAADETVLAVSCQDAREDVRDTGYAVTITTGGFTGLTIATVSEQTIAGPRVLKTVIVRQSDQGMQRIYQGTGFNLNISLESLVQTANHSAAMFLRQIVEGDIAVAINAELICKIND